MDKGNAGTFEDVDRRTGGLETIMIALIDTEHVDRRTGGLETLVPEDLTT